MSIAVAFPKSGRAPDGGHLVGVPQPARARARTDSEVRTSRLYQSWVADNQRAIATLGSRAEDSPPAAAQSPSKEVPEITPNLIRSGIQTLSIRSLLPELIAGERWVSARAGESNAIQSDG